MVGALFSCKPVDTESSSTSSVSSASSEEYLPKVESASALAAIGLADKASVILTLGLLETQVGRMLKLKIHLRQQALLLA